MGKRTAQKDAIKDITSDGQVNSYIPYRWSPASLTFNIYFYLFLYLYITRITINNGTPHLKSPRKPSIPSYIISKPLSSELEHNNFSSPEPKAPGELIGWEALIVRPSSIVRRPSTLSNDFSSETTGQNVNKFHM